MWHISLRSVEKPNYSTPISDTCLERRKWLYSFCMMLKICTEDKAAFLNENIFKPATGRIWKELVVKHFETNVIIQQVLKYKENTETTRGLQC